MISMKIYPTKMIITSPNIDVRSTLILPFELETEATGFSSMRPLSLPTSSSTLYECLKFYEILYLFNADVK